MIIKASKKTPIVSPEHVFLNIARDFCRPLDSIREAISNAVDFHATEIHILIWENKKIPGGELVIEISDNGDGMDEMRLEAFFNLGDSTHIGEDGTKLDQATGEKGHGTKTYYNSRQIEVFTKTKTGNKLYALMDEPLKNLLNRKMPDYVYDPNPKYDITQGTKIVIRGFNQNVKRDFSHRILKDHILWLTKFANFSWVFESSKPKSREESNIYKTGPKLYLHGLGYEQDWEEIRYCHIFPPECTNLNELKKIDANEPIRWYVKRWSKKGLTVKEFPNVKLDVIFSLEGDLVRRDYNPMISYHGKKYEGDYTIEQRYGLWASKDYIPIRQVNDWFSAGKSEWTKFHAFVNCQDFALTANRADVNNTDQKLLDKIEETVKDYFEKEVEDTPEFNEYTSAVKLQEGYRNKKQEMDDFKKRKARASKKYVAYLNGIELLSPGAPIRGASGQEIGVHVLFAQLIALKPDLFPFKVVDYDTHKGYDCLISHGVATDLTNPSLSFLEFKYMLDTTFNHSFDNLHYIVCWDSAISPGTEITDLTNESRILEVSLPDEHRNYTAYHLHGRGKFHNIEVFVLKKYIAERLGINFEPKET